MLTYVPFPFQEEEAARKLADASELAFTALELNEDAAVGVSSVDANR